MYNQSGDVLTIAREFGNKIENIPAGAYTVEFNQNTGDFFLQKTSSFTLPSKVYGELDTRSGKVINTFLNRQGKNTGVLLSGTKGAGKTQLAKDISVSLEKMGIPTIIIQNCYTGGTFINFIKAISDKALVLFDEFEKVYNEQEAQESILTLLDGTGSYNKLYILTSNSSGVSEFLRNRPSRIFYHFEYKKLSKSTMMDLLNDKLINKAFIPQFETLHDVAETISFDMIQCLIEELNRYQTQTFTETFRELNVEVEYRSRSSYKTSEFTIDGKEIKFDDENLNNFTAFSFMAKYDSFRLYFYVDEGILENELKEIGAQRYNVYDEDEDEISNDEDENVKEYQYFINLDFNKNDTDISANDIVINRTFGEHKVHARFTKTETPDVIETMFDGK